MILNEKGSIRNRLKNSLNVFEDFGKSLSKMEKNGTVDKMIGFFQNIAKTEVISLIRGGLTRNKGGSTSGKL